MASVARASGRWRLPITALLAAPRELNWCMLIEVNTDKHIQGRADVAASVQGMVDGALDHFRERITRVEVHLGDENGSKGGGSDIRCSLEARIEGHQPVAVTHHADSVEEAVEGAAEKLDRVLEHTLGRLEAKRPKLDGSAADVSRIVEG